MFYNSTTSSPNPAWSILQMRPGLTWAICNNIKITDTKIVTDQSVLRNNERNVYWQPVSPAVT